MYDPQWSHIDVNSVPHLVTESAGPEVAGDARAGGAGT